MAEAHKKALPRGQIEIASSWEKAPLCVHSGCHRQFLLRDFSKFVFSRIGPEGEIFFSGSVSSHLVSAAPCSWESLRLA